MKMKMDEQKSDSLDMVKRFGEKSKCNPDLFTLHFLRDFSLCT